MEKVSLDEVDNEPNPLGVHELRKPLSDALGTEDVSVVYYELNPGEQFSGGLHTHHDQEEIFVVLEGTATWEVREPRSGSERSSGEGTDPRDVTERDEVEVDEGEAVRFPPGQFQVGRNQSDEEVRGLAIGAPGARHNWEDIESFAPCSECDEVTSHGVEEPDESGMTVYCNECGTELF